MALPVEIHDLRLSFLWTETSLDLLGVPAPAQAPLAFLGRRSSYIAKFDEAIQNGTPQDGLMAPWDTPKGHKFWYYYLGCREPGEVKGLDAWRGLVPFRVRGPLTIRAPWLPGFLVTEGFYYPHGFALVLTATCRGRFPLESAVERAFQIRQDGRFDIGPENGPAESVTLDRAAEKGQAALRTRSRGPNASPGARSARPFSILTVVRGQGVDPAADMGEEVHRALNAVSSWSQTWEKDVLPAKTAVSLGTRNAPAGHVLYGRTRGRAVWFPDQFAERAVARRRPSMACYHKNLTMLSLQVESLGSLIAAVAREVQENSAASLSPEVLECARRGAGILSRLYIGKPGETYHSWSPHFQIEQNDLLSPINTVRDYFNMPSIP